MRDRPLHRSLAPVAAIVAVIALATLATWPTPRTAAASAIAARADASRASSVSAAELSSDPTAIAPSASDRQFAPSSGNGVATAASYGVIGSNDGSPVAHRASVASAPSHGPSTESAPGSDQSPDATSSGGAIGDRRDPLAEVRALGTPGVYRNRVGGSWVNVPPPDRHYDHAPDPRAPSGAG